MKLFCIRRCVLAGARATLAEPEHAFTSSSLQNWAKSYGPSEQASSGELNLVVPPCTQTPRLADRLQIALRGTGNAHCARPSVILALAISWRGSCMHGMRLDFREDHAASCPSPFEHSPIQPAGDANDGRRCEGPGTVMNTTEGELGHCSGC